MKKCCSGPTPHRAAVRLSFLIAALTGGTLFLGCSSGTTSQPATGGSVATGGTLASGGSAATGGNLSSGGTLATGGTQATGGTATATGGKPVATGGTNATGGKSSSGGTTGSGGEVTSGGTASSGGVESSGGTASAGGITATGGVVGSGGVASSGGMPSSGGSGGRAATGGTLAATGGATGGTGAGTGGVLAAGGVIAANGGAPSGGGYIFACFDDAAALSSLMIYTSTDALNFSLLLDTKYTGPTQNLRDPSIMKHTDGKYYVVHTTPPGPGTGCCGAETSFAVATSADLKTWTPVTQVQSGLAGTSNVWAPEWFKDSDGTLHVLVSVAVNGAPKKTYRYEPTDGTFTKWGPGTWIGIGPDYIDTFMVKIGTTYHAFTKHETATAIRHGTSSSLDGPWVFTDDTDGTPTTWGTHKEAPSVIQLANGNWRIYMDAGSAGHEMYSDSTDTFKSWTKVQTLPNVGNNISHGTVIHGN